MMDMSNPLPPTRSQFGFSCLVTRAQRCTLSLLLYQFLFTLLPPSSDFTPTHSLSLSCHVGNASLPSSPFPLQIKMTPCSKIEVNLLSTPFKKIPLLLMLILDRFDVDDGLGDSKGMGTPSCPSPSSPHATRSLLPLRVHVNLISTSHFLLFHFFLFKPSSSPASWSL